MKETHFHRKCFRNQKKYKKNKGFRGSARPSLTISGAEGPIVVKALEELRNRSAALEETKNAVTPVFLRVEKNGRGGRPVGSLLRNKESSSACVSDGSKTNGKRPHPVGAQMQPPKN